MSTFDENPYSVHFAQFASKLEQHLRRNGISCDDADRIIEESSAIYFEKLGSSASKLMKMIKKQDPADVFVDSAYRAIANHLPEAKGTFGSQREISKVIR
ncbi:MAG: hypothetical protein ABI347_00925 [Nitrososphaera sp.]